MQSPVTSVVFDYGGVLSLPVDPASLRTLAGMCGMLLERLHREDLRGWSRINDRVLAWSRALRAAGFLTGILSNLPWPLLDLMNADPSFAWLGEPAGSCLFLDDIEGNVAGARAIGLQAFHFLSADEASAAFEGLDLPRV